MEMIRLFMSLCALASGCNHSGNASDIEELAAPYPKEIVETVQASVGTGLLSTDALASFNCTDLEGMAFGRAETTKSYICVVRMNPEALPGRGFYLKGRIRIKADGNSTRFRMVGFGLAGETNGISGKFWSARHGLPLKIDEAVPVGLGLEACLAGNPPDSEVGQLNVFADANSGLMLSEFEAIELVPTRCK